LFVATFLRPTVVLIGYVNDSVPSVRPFPSRTSPIDSILKLVTVWKITGQIIRTTIVLNYICTHIMEFLQFYVLLVFCVSVKVKLTVPFLCVCVHSA